MTTPKLDLDLDEAEGLSRKAAEGPWFADGQLVSSQVGSIYPRVANAFYGNDADFIAFYRTFVPLAVARIRKLQVRIQLLQVRIAELEAQAKEDEVVMRSASNKISAICSMPIERVTGGTNVNVLLDRKRLLDERAARKREEG